MLQVDFLDLVYRTQHIKVEGGLIPLIHLGAWSPNKGIFFKKKKTPTFAPCPTLNFNNLDLVLHRQILRVQATLGPHPNCQPSLPATHHLSAKASCRQELKEQIRSNSIL